MGNYVASNSTKSDFKMSNGGFTVFLTTLGLSGSVLATTKKEMELILWLLEHDLEVRGLGNGGFDLAEMPWEYTNFEIEKEFLSNVIKCATSKMGWDKLDYQPNEELVFGFLNNFMELILKFDSEYIDDKEYPEWINASITDYEARFYLEGFNSMPWYSVISMVIFVCIMLTGIILGIIFRHNKSLKGLILIGAFILALLFVIPIYLGMRSMHTVEINRVIQERGGKEVNIEQIFSSADSPLEARSANSIYKITYKKNGKNYVAWYRGINNGTDIHHRVQKSFEEKWIFNE